MLNEKSIKKILIILFAFSFVLHRSMPLGPVNAGLADCVIGIVFAVACVTFVLKRGSAAFSLPPVYITACICATFLSGAVASLAGGGKAVLKEEIQIIEVLCIGWLAVSFLLEKNRVYALLLMRVLIMAAGFEAVAVGLRQLISDDMFHTGFFTRNRNTYSMLVMVCAPAAAYYAVHDTLRLLRIGYSLILFCMFSTVLSAGALVGGVIGIGAVWALGPERRRYTVCVLIPVVLGIALLSLRTDMRSILAASVSGGIEENYLIKNRDSVYLESKEKYIRTSPQWFAQDTAFRYRRWKYAADHARSSVKRLLIGSGPSSFNSALKPYSAEEGVPNIDTDEVMMFNIGISEPDTFSAYAVWQVEYGLAGFAVLLVLLAVPAAKGMRKKSRIQSPGPAAGAALLCLMICNVFHSHMITGMYILAVALIYCAETDFDQPLSVQKNGETEDNGD